VVCGTDCTLYTVIYGIYYDIKCKKEDKGALYYFTIYSFCSGLSSTCYLTHYLSFYFIINEPCISYIEFKGDYYGRDRMVIRYTTTCAISAYHH